MRSGSRSRPKGPTDGRARQRDGPAFPDRSFDLVTSFDVLYALDDEQEAKAFDEMARVLKPGARWSSTSPRWTSCAAAIGGARRGAAAVHAGLDAPFVAAQRTCGRRASTYTNASLFPMLATVRTMQRLTGWPVPGSNWRCQPRRSTPSLPACSRWKPASFGASTCRSAARCCASRDGTERQGSCTTCMSSTRRARWRRSLPRSRSAGTKNWSVSIVIRPDARSSAHGRSERHGKVPLPAARASRRGRRASGVTRAEHLVANPQRHL